MLKTVFAFLAATVLAAAGTWAQYTYIVWYSDLPEEIIMLQEEPGQLTKLFFMFFIYFTLLVVLPVAQTHILKQVHIGNSKWWLGIAILEPLLLFYAIAFTPPDLISTLVLFTFCQLVVILNTVVLRTRLRKLEEPELTR